MKDVDKTLEELSEPLIAAMANAMLEVAEEFPDASEDQFMSVSAFAAFATGVRILKEQGRQNGEIVVFALAAVADVLEDEALGKLAIAIAERARGVAIPGEKKDTRTAD